MTNEQNEFGILSEIERQIRRLQRKLKKRDKNIEGMKRRIVDLEHALAMKDFQIKQLPLDVTRAVQNALCNVRMIPVFDAGKSAKILEVKYSNAPTQPKPHLRPAPTPPVPPAEGKHNENDQQDRP